MKLVKGANIVDVPESQVAFFLKIGYEKVEEKPVIPETKGSSDSLDGLFNKKENQP
jgi:hypothetical protein